MLGNQIHFSVVGHSWAIEKCGGIPLLIPLLQGNGFEDLYLDLIDGLLLTEGEDMSPYTYNNKILPECSEKLDPQKAPKA